jgi:hypothetical protein
MGYKQYLSSFQNAAGQLDINLLQHKQIEVAVGEVLNSVFLKLYKRSWANPFQDPLTSESRIFFSVWISDASIKEQRICYNIHALKLRHLKGYTIQSRQFAAIFRTGFKPFEKKWKNVSVTFGPLTLMEGWLKADLADLEKDIVELANKFLDIEHLVDETLVHFK